MPGCEYFRDGGEVAPIQPMQHAHPSVTLGHAAVSHGLLGLLKNVGHAKMSDPDKHTKTIQDAKDQSAFRKSGGDQPQKMSTGHKMADHIIDGRHEEAANMIHGHPLVGSSTKNGLKPIMARLGPAILDNEPEPEALRGSVEYLHSAISGTNSIESQMKKLLGKKKKSDMIEPDEAGGEALKKHLEELEENPEKLFDTGGKLGHYLPEHATALGAMAATATNYFRSLRPTQTKSSPLDEVAPPDKSAVAEYDRQINIAQKPQLILQNINEGTILPQDLKTVQTIYPGLFKTMQDKATEAMISAKTEDREIPYKQRQSLSMLLGQPLDATMTSSSMQAIIKSAGAQQAQNQANNKKSSPEKATSVELSQVNKVNSMFETPEQRREMNRKS